MARYLACFLLPLGTLCSCTEQQDTCEAHSLPSSAALLLQKVATPLREDHPLLHAATLQEDRWAPATALKTSLTQVFQQAISSIRTFKEIDETTYVLLQLMVLLVIVILIGGVYICFLHSRHPQHHEPSQRPADGSQDPFSREQPMARNVSQDF